MSLRHVIPFLTAATIISGCTNQGYSVVATTATVIGANISHRPADGSIDTTLGYKRAEFAFVPTNRSSGKNMDSHHGGAKDTTDVILELNSTGIWSADNSRIYQRLAVGKNAVESSGSTLIFAKDKEGNISDEVAKALKNVTTIPEAEHQSSLDDIPQAH